MSERGEARPLLRLVRGEPDDAELAALTAVVAAIAAARAAQPEPGRRLLQFAVTSRKYAHRVRCMTLPPIVAMLRSCAEALNSRASEMTGYCARTSGCAARSAIRVSAPTRRPPPLVSSTPASGRALMSTSSPGRSTVSRMRSTSVVPPAM